MIFKITKSFSDFDSDSWWLEDRYYAMSKRDARVKSNKLLRELEDLTKKGTPDQESLTKFLNKWDAFESQMTSGKGAKAIAAGKDGGVFANALKKKEQMLNAIGATDASAVARDYMQNLPGNASNVGGHSVKTKIGDRNVSSQLVADSKGVVSNEQINQRAENLAKAIDKAETNRQVHTQNYDKVRQTKQGIAKTRDVSAEAEKEFLDTVVTQKAEKKMQIADRLERRPETREKWQAKRQEELARREEVRKRRADERSARQAKKHEENLRIQKFKEEKAAAERAKRAQQEAIRRRDTVFMSNPNKPAGVGVQPRQSFDPNKTNLDFKLDVRPEPKPAAARAETVAEAAQQAARDVAKGIKPTVKPPKNNGGGVRPSGGGGGSAAAGKSSAREAQDAAKIASKKGFWTSRNKKIAAAAGLAGLGALGYGAYRYNKNRED